METKEKITLKSEENRAGTRDNTQLQGKKQLKTGTNKERLQRDLEKKLTGGKTEGKLKERYWKRHC